MKKSKVYTKTGDKGETSLVSGNRLSKADSKIDLYGEIDELNSHVGLGVCYLQKHEAVFQKPLELLYKIQHVLFDLGSNLACEDEFREKYKLPQISESIIQELELDMDEMDGELPKLNNFVLPGGDLACAQFHVCRTVTRRFERKLIQSLAKENAPDNSLVFTNRLSDYFFILSRYVNFKLGKDEVLWQVGVY